MLAAFYSELDNLAQFAEFTVIPFDTEVAADKVYVWKKGERRKAERVLHGGTCFDAPTRFVNDGKFDGHIVLTDMCAPKPIASKCQRMWMTTTETHATHTSPLPRSWSPLTASETKRDKIGVAQVAPVGYITGVRRRDDA